MAGSALTPELACTDAAASAAFYTGALGFTQSYARPAQGFYHLSREGASLMLEQLSDTSWLAAPATPPLGRGMHLQLMATDAPALAGRLEDAGHPLFRPLEEAWYRAGDIWHGQAQFVVADPDGYLLRFATPLGTARERPASGRIVE